MNASGLVPPTTACAEPAEARTGPGRRAWAWRLAAWLPALGFLAVVLAPPVNHDAAAILEFSARWLAGEGLYTDLLDVNPPLIFLLSAVPAAIGAHSPLGQVPALQLCVLGLCGAAALLALRIARGAEEGPVTAACLAVCIPLLTLAAGYEFAQREHLMVVAALPYLVHAALRAEGGARAASAWPAIGMGVLAAAGFALKPHFLAIPVLVEGLVLLRRGPRLAWRDPVPWTMLAAWIGYVVLILAAFPDYPRHVIPLARAYYLGLGDLGWWQVLALERMGSVLLVLLPLGLLAFLARGRGALPQVLALAAAGGVLAALIQHKGWDYHILPARLLTGLMAVVLAGRWLDAALPSARARGAAPAIGALAALALAVFQVTGAAGPWREFRWPRSDGAELAEVVARVATGRRVLVLSPYIDPVAQALAQAGARSSLPAMTLWVLQGAYGAVACAGQGERYRAPADMPPAEAALWNRVAEGFAAAPPAAVLVALDPRIANCGRGFDLVEYFGRHPRFAETFRRYRPGPVAAGHRLFARAAE